MTTTPLPPLAKSTPEQDDLFDHLYEYGVSAEGVHERLEKVCQAYATAARADLEVENAELKRKLVEASNTLCIGGQMISAIAHALDNTK